LKYSPESQTLFSQDGKLIKSFSCPLNKKWQHLSLTDNDLVRFCGSCSKDVTDISSFNEQQIIAIFKVSPESCAYLNFDEATETIELEESMGLSGCNNDTSKSKLPVIQTIRGEDAINSAVRQGLKLDIRPTDVGGSIQLTVRWVIDDQGYVRPADQYRSEPGEFRTEHPQGYVGSALSAYVIPNELKPGSEVYIADVIQHVVESTHHSEYRLKTGTGLWNGKKVVVHKPKVRRMIG
jgi:hypothetical protein